MARTYPMGAMRSGLAIGEVQALVNPCTGSGERGVSPGSPGQWTVVTITPGVGAGEGARPHWRERIPWCNVSMRLISDPDCSPPHPDRGPWWASPRGVGNGRGLAPSPQAAELVDPSSQPPPHPASGLLPRPSGAGAVCGDTRGKTCPGHDNLPRRTGQTFIP